MSMRASYSYLFGIQLVGVSLPVAHDTEFHWEENVGLLSLYQGHPRLHDSNIILLLEVVDHTHIGGLAGGFLSHVELMLEGIDPSYLLHCPDFRF